MLFKTDEETLSSKLLSRVYTSGFVMISAVAILFGISIYLKIFEVSNTLKSSNFRSYTYVKNHFNSIIDNIDLLYRYLEIEKSDDILKDLVTKNGNINGIYISDKDGKILKSYQVGDTHELEGSISKFWKKDFGNNELYMSNFHQKDSTTPFSIIAIQKDEDIVLAKANINNALERIYNDQHFKTNSFLIDSKGLMLSINPEDKTIKNNNIYDTYRINHDWRNDDSIHISVNSITGKLEFYSISYDKTLNTGIVTTLVFYEMFYEYFFVPIIIFIGLILVALMFYKDINLIKFDIITPFNNLMAFISGLKVGEIIDNTRDLYAKKEFRTISENFLELHTRLNTVQSSLAEYKERQKLVFEGSAIIILFLDPYTGQITEASEAAVNFYGYDKGRLLSMDIFDLEILNPYESSAQQILAAYDNVDLYQTKHKLKNGDIRIVEIKSTMIKTYGHNFYFVVIKDVTKQQLLIENTKQEIKKIIDSPLLVINFDVSNLWIIKNISNNVASILGYDVEDFLSKDTSFAFITHKDDFITLTNDINHGIKTQNYSVKGEEFSRLCRLRTKDSGYEWFKVSVSMQFIDGEINEVTLFFINFSDVKKKEIIYNETINRYKNIVNAASDMVWEWDINRDVYKFSNKFANILGYKQISELDPINLSTLQSMMHKIDFAKYQNCILEYMGGASDSFSVDVRFKTLFGDYVCLAIKGKSISRDSSGTPTYICGIMEDVTENRKYRSQLELLASVFSYSREGITITDLKGRIIDANDAFVEITGYTREEALNQNPRILKSGKHDDNFYRAMWSDLNKTGFWRGEIWNRRKNGEIYPSILTISAVKNTDGEVIHYVAIFSDISHIKENEARLEKIAHFDALTKLPNRFLLMDRLKQAMARTKRNSSKILVAYLDLDGFKNVNDTYGHHYGDALLVEVSKNMNNVLRDADTVARLGGDEFVAVIADIDKDSSIVMLNRLLECVSKEIIINNQVIQISTSIGATFYPQSKDIDSDGLLRQADFAMYQAKLNGKNKYYFFDENETELTGQYDSAKNNFDISSALKNNEIYLVYQPRVDIKNGKIMSFDAMSIWKHPSQGLVLCNTFLPFILNQDSFNKFGVWVIKTALLESNKWSQNIPVSVNLSLSQLASDEIKNVIFEISQDSNFDLSRLSIDVIGISDSSELKSNIEIIKEYEGYGIKFIIDDFDSLHSTIQILKEIPNSEIRLDEKLPSKISQDMTNLNILEGIYDVMHEYSRRILIKGVDDIVAYKVLSQIGYVYMQGNFISEPLLSDEVDGFLSNFKAENIPAVSAKTSLNEYKFAIWHSIMIENFIEGINSDNLYSFDTEAYAKEFSDFIENVENIDFHIEIYKEIIESLDSPKENMDDFVILLKNMKNELTKKFFG